MLEKNKKLIKNPILARFKEHQDYNQNLHALTMFPYTNVHMEPQFFNATLNINFKGIDFNKKRALPFFLAMELLTNQKCVATLSSKNVLAWKLRKGMLVGCKVTLRKKNLAEFFDSLSLALPRMEKFTPIKVGKNNTNSYSLKLAEVVLFYPIELGLGVNTEVQKIEVNFFFKTISKEEKIFLLTSNKIPVLNQ